MNLIVSSMYDFSSFLTKNLDPRLADWPLMSKPLLTLAISLLYIYIVKILGPALMENRKPFQLKKTLFVYNLFQVIFSSWLFYRFASGGWLTGEYNFICQPLDTSTSPQALMMVSSMYWYFISKYTEFLDTIFFVMRKKYQQITTLHVIHHGIMPFGAWIAAAYSPGGQVTFVPLLNTFVHIIMYSYYLLSALGPEIQKYLWWKKYLTGLQITQFIAVIIQSSQPLFIECPYPKAISYWVTCETGLFLYLFKKFYDGAYNKKQTGGASSEEVSEKPWRQKAEKKTH
ncbi:very long chain fatty acid elongase AAEL008004 [Leptinotarsa decemlineata]|uniref:very long chain fatty acid elongase AAEL008004 n=1 Tax=Leptinotarsa decemlineata TaxID=7539 RepID=UPI003D307CB5